MTHSIFGLETHFMNSGYTHFLGVGLEALSRWVVDIIFEYLISPQDQQDETA